MTGTTEVTVPAARAPDSVAAGPSRYRLVAYYLLICAIWGTTWYGMKISVDSIPPMTAAGLRFLIAFPFLAVAVRVSPTATFRFPPGKGWLLPFVAIAYIAVPYALINYGEQRISSGFASLIFASVTVFLLIFSRIISGIRVASTQWVGIVLGLACLCVLVVSTEGDLTARNLVAPGAVLLAAVMHALVYATLARHAGDVHVLTTEALPLGLGGALLLGLGMLTEHPHFGAVTTRSWLGVVYLGVVASVIGFAVYFYLLKHISAVSLSFVFVFFPVIAIGVSSVAEHDHLGPLALTMAAGMLASFALTKRGQR